MLGLVFVLSVLHSTSCGEMIEVGGAGGVVVMTLPGWKCEFFSVLVVFVGNGREVKAAVMCGRSLLFFSLFTLSWTVRWD